MAAIPDEPRERHRRVGFAALPAVRGASSGSRLRKTWIRASPRPSRIGVRRSLSMKASRANAITSGERSSAWAMNCRGQLERRVRHDAFAAIRRLALHQEVAAVEVRWVAVVHEVAADHLVTGGTQHLDDVAGAAAGSQSRWGSRSCRSSASTATGGVSYRSSPRSLSGCRRTWHEGSSISGGPHPEVAHQLFPARQPRAEDRAASGRLVPRGMGGYCGRQTCLVLNTPAELRRRHRRSSRLWGALTVLMPAHGRRS